MSVSIIQQRVMPLFTCGEHKIILSTRERERERERERKQVCLGIGARAGAPVWMVCSNSRLFLQQKRRRSTFTYT